jgi:hypothetical protein
MKTSKIWLIVGINFFFLFCTWQYSTSCAWEEENSAMYSFFNAELSGKTSYKPLYFSFDRLYSYEWAGDSSATERQEIVNEWYDFTNKKASKNDIEKVVFDNDVAQLQKLKNYVFGIEKTNTTNNSFANYLAQNKDIESLNYLLFARNCEKYAKIGNDWSMHDNSDSKEFGDNLGKMQKYSREAEAKANKTANPFLKLRYAFQAVRMAHYGSEYQRAIQLYDQLVARINLDIPLKYRALGHKAGAMRRAGQNPALAAYLFSIMFDKCQTKRINAYISFRIYDDQEWQKTMSYCKNNREKTTLYFLRAIHPQNQMLEEIKNIYQLDVKSEYLSILLVREMNKLEQQLIPSKVDKNAVAVKQETLISLKNYVGKYKNFIKLAIDENKVEDPTLWIMALAYCDYMLENTAEAKKSLAQINVQKLSKKSKRQMEVFEAMLQLSELQKVDASAEEKYYSLSQALKHEGVNALLQARFASLYKNQKEIAKEYLIYHDLIHLENSPNLAIVDALLQFTDKPSKSSYEKYLIDSKIAAKNPKKMLLEIKATILLGQNKLEEAEKLLIESGVNTRLIGNVQADETQDCHECQQAGKTFTKLELVRKIKDLQEKATQSNIVAATNYYQLGNIYYNITNFGNAWRALDYYRSGSDLLMLQDKSSSNYYEKDFMALDCSMALSFYKKSIEFANKIKNKELAAKATFMAAKCEQNQYYISSDARKEDFSPTAPTYNSKYRTYFKSLKDNYSSTKFYQKAIAECSYFNKYVRFK